MFFNTYKCKHCNHTITKFEPYNTIYLSAPQESLTCNIHDILKTTYSNEGTEIDLACSKCSKKRFIKNVSLWTIPDTLIINFKRSNTTKTLINYPLNNLNLTPYLSKQNGDANNYIYDLYAINFHQSTDGDSGHYHSCCKNIIGEWIYFNDNHVIKINDETLLNRIINKDACILFYQRKRKY
jgi:DNA-directed RNA polymerase subunit RPC12/RpoP